MNFVTKFTLVATSLAVSVAAVDQQAVSAATVNYAFAVENSLISGKGSFSFDDSTFDNGAIPTALVKSLNFTFNNDPQTVYTEQDDIDYPDAPFVFPTVAGNSSIGLSYLFLDKFDTSISYEIAGSDFIVGNQTFSNAVSYAPIPEPATLVGTLTVCSLGLFMSRKGKSAKKVA